jgi:hypothetical protein
MIQSSPVLIKRGQLGDAASGVRMTYYGSDYSQASNGQYIGDVPPYAPYGIGACGEEPVNKNYFVAMNSGTFSGTCGLCAKVTYGGNCVVAPIVDLCPGCGSGLDMSLQGFGELVGGEAAARQMGVANVDFEIVLCPRGRASTGSSSYADSDPCSGSSVGDLVSSSQSTSVTASTSSQSTSVTTSTSSQSTSVTTSTSSQSTGTATTSEANDVVITISSSSTTLTTTVHGATPTGDKKKCGADGTLYGFPCCTSAAKVNDAWVDKNGFAYGWENETTCIAAN